MKINNRNQNLNFYAVKQLQKFGVADPNFQQIEDMKSLLARIGIVVSEIIFPSNLSRRETAYLALAIRGKRISEIAKDLNISESSIQTYRERIKEKLKCTTMEQAIFECIRYCYLSPV